MRPIIQIGVEALERTGDHRFGYFSNKLNNLIMKKHVLLQLHGAIDKSNRDSFMKRAELNELKGKKEDHEMQKLINSDLASIQRVKEMLHSAYNKELNFDGWIKNSLSQQ